MSGDWWAVNVSFQLHNFWMAEHLRCLLVIFEKDVFDFRMLVGGVTEDGLLDWCFGLVSWVSRSMELARPNPLVNR